MEKGSNFPDLKLLACILVIFYSDTFDRINDFTFIVLIIIAPVFNMGMSLGEVKSGKIPEVYLQNGAGTL